MRTHTFLPLCTLLSSFVWGQDTDLKTVKATFDKYGIPEDLALNFDPKVLLNVYFQQVPFGTTISFKAGDDLPRNVTTGPIRFGVTYPGTTGPVWSRYVIIAVDPDAPTPEEPTSAQIRHFLGGNFVHPLITPTPKSLLTNTTVAVSEYRQPNPPVQSDYHRYIFLLYNQSPAFDAQKLVTPETPIQLWNVSTFARDVGLGDPVGGTFMRVKAQV